MGIIFDSAQFKDKIKKAMEKPYAWPEIDERIKTERLVTQKQLYEKIKDIDLEKKLAKLTSETPSIIINSLSELEAIMDYLNIKDDVNNDVLIDMKFQYDKAADQGFPCRFSVWFYKAIPIGIAMYCATQIYISTEKSK